MRLPAGKKRLDRSQQANANRHGVDHCVPVDSRSDQPVTPAVSPISPGVRNLMRKIAARNTGYGLCWKCLEWHRGLVEIECRGWLCERCRET